MPQTSYTLEFERLQDWNWCSPWSQSAAASMVGKTELRLKNNFKNCMKGNGCIHYHLIRQSRWTSRSQLRYINKQCNEPPLLPRWEKKQSIPLLVTPGWAVFLFLQQNTHIIAVVFLVDDAGKRRQRQQMENLYGEEQFKRQDIKTIQKNNNMGKCADRQEFQIQNHTKFI